MKLKKRNSIKEKTFDFSARFIGLAEKLRNEKHYEIASQLVKSGTSIGTNVEVADSAASKKDFLFKMSLSSKEAKETIYWLRLIIAAEALSDATVTPVLEDAIGISKILTSSVKTTHESI